MKTNAGMLKRFYESEKYWPKGYTVYDLLITVEGDEDLTDEFEDITSPPISERSGRMEELKELVEDFMERQQDLKEFEEELEKNKDKLTPGTIGES